MFCGSSERDTTQIRNVKNLSRLIAWGTIGVFPRSSPNSSGKWVQAAFQARNPLPVRLNLSAKVAESPGFCFINRFFLCHLKSVTLHVKSLPREAKLELLFKTSGYAVSPQRFPVFPAAPCNPHFPRPPQNAYSQQTSCGVLTRQKEPYNHLPTSTLLYL